MSYLGRQKIATGTQFAGTTAGGLSGIDYDAATQSYWAVSDDRSQLNDARFYTVKLDLTQFNTSANPGMAGVQFTGVTTLRDLDGAAFGAGLVDHFSATQVTQFLAFEVTAVPEPQTYALMLGGLGAVGWIARRRAPR